MSFSNEINVKYLLKELYYEFTAAFVHKVG